MATEKKSPKRLISSIRLKMTQVTDAKKQNKNLLFLLKLKYISKLLNPKKYKVKKNTADMKEKVM